VRELNLEPRAVWLLEHFEVVFDIKDIDATLLQIVNGIA
jgi:hypothetical protein